MPDRLSRPELLFFGDSHGDFEAVAAAVEALSPKAIVLLGDLQPLRPLHLELAAIALQTEVWFIHGNHDTDSDADFDNLFGSELAHRNLHGRVETISGYRVAGLGGIFRDKVWDPNLPMEQAKFRSAEAMHMHARRGPSASDGDPRTTWRGGFTRKHHSSIFPEDYERMQTQRADILVSHEAPSAHRHGFSAIDSLAIQMGCVLVVHGHHHEDIDYRSQKLMPADSPFEAFGVDKGSFLSWPPRADGPFRRIERR